MKFRLFLSLCVAFPNVLATQTFANNSPSPAGLQDAVLKNVELDESGILNLLVVDNIGNPQPDVAVHLNSGNLQASGVTDEFGQLLIPQLSGGTCMIQIQQQMFACRVWKNGTAPPKSLKSIALVNDDPTIVRGNGYAQGNYCPPNQCEPTHHLSSKAKYGLAITALGATAAYMALSRDNASE